MTAMASRGQDNRMHPYLQGQLKVQAPYFYDVLGYISNDTIPNPDPTKLPYKARRMYVERTDEFEAGERTGGRLGSVVEQQNLSVEKMLDMVFGEKTEKKTSA
jgi:hypothetical protein